MRQWDFELDPSVGRRAFLRGAVAATVVVGFGSVSVSRAWASDSQPGHLVIDGNIKGLAVAGDRAIAVGARGGRPVVWLGDSLSLGSSSHFGGNEHIVLHDVEILNDGSYVVVGAVAQTVAVEEIDTPVTLPPNPLHDMEDSTPTHKVAVSRYEFRPAVWTSDYGKQWRTAGIGAFDGVLTSVIQGPNLAVGAVGLRLDESDEGVGVITAGKAADGGWEFWDSSAGLPASEGGAVAIAHDSYDWLVTTTRVGASHILKTSDLKWGFEEVLAIQNASIADAVYTSGELVVVMTDIPTSASTSEHIDLRFGKHRSSTPLKHPPTALAYDKTDAAVSIVTRATDSTSEVTREST